MYLNEDIQWYLLEYRPILYVQKLRWVNSHHQRVISMRALNKLRLECHTQEENTKELVSSEVE